MVKHYRYYCVQTMSRYYFDEAYFIHCDICHIISIYYSIFKVHYIFLYIFWLPTWILGWFKVDLGPYSLKLLKDSCLSQAKVLGPSKSAWLKQESLICSSQLWLDPATIKILCYIYMYIYCPPYQWFTVNLISEPFHINMARATWYNQILVWKGMQNQSINQSIHLIVPHFYWSS